MVFIRRKVNSQPQSVARLATGNPLARGIVAWQTGVDRNGFNESGPIVTTTVPTIAGVARNYAYDTVNYTQFGWLSKTIPTTNTPTTLVALVRFNSSGLDPTLEYGFLGTSRASLWVERFGLSAFGNGTTYNWSFNVRQLPGISARATSSITVDGNWHLVVGRQSTATSRDLWVDGISQASNATSAQPTSIVQANIGLIDGSYFAWNGDIALTIIYNRALSNAEIVEISSNPWQVFDTPHLKRRIVDFGSAPTTGWTYRARQAPNQQPASPVVNSGHPIADGLIAWQTGVASSGFTEVGTVPTPVVATEHGFARTFDFDENGINTQALGADARATVNTVCTLAALVRANTAELALGASRFMGIGRTSGGTNVFELSLTETAWSFLCWQSGATVIRSVTAPYTTGDEGWHFVVGRQSSSTYRDIWVDGVKGSSDTVSCSPTGMTRATVGGYSFGASTPEWGGGIAIALFWNRGLTDNEIRSLSRNPWQLFQQPRRIHAATKIYRPYSDITTAGWTARPDAPYFRQLAETVPSDSNYIFSPDPSGSPGAFVAGLNASMEAGTYNIKFRARKTTSAGQIRATLLDASGSSVGASGWISLTTGFADYTATVTSSAPAARIKLEVQP